MYQVVVDSSIFSLFLYFREFKKEDIIVRMFILSRTSNRSWRSPTGENY